MSSSARTITRLEDYTPPPYLIPEVTLEFDLYESHCDVTATLCVRRNPTVGHASPNLELDGRGLPLLSAELDGKLLGTERIDLTEDKLIIGDVPDAFQLRLRTRIKPQENTALEGLYKSSGNFCTQCEAQGFRRIVWFADRPDVMSVFTTTIVADQVRYPVLLSNGNKVAAGERDGGRHFATWHDPFPKPTYLFALVAGHLARVEDHYVTASARKVALHIYVEPHNIDRCDHAMASLKKAMHWDEQTYGLEYDLDTFMVVAVDDFNMGAMENKGLNIFNSKYVLARPDTATDTDFQNIEGIIAHEYFHNWTGNRVTCRDWFQLSLKEGLTVYRDQEFSADMGSSAVKRIQDVRILRTHQFSEDAGPMAHPVRPQSYLEISNFYTVTVYNKGAELIRMMHTILGDDAFKRGIALYFERHDGQAVTTDDFVLAMENASGADLTQFRHWYSQAGTPQVTVHTNYDAQTQCFSVNFEQSTPPTPGQSEKQALHIPLRIALLGAHGERLPLSGEHPGLVDDVFHLTEERAHIVFNHIAQVPTLSIARGFSAPIKLDLQRSDEELSRLMALDDDEFNRWDAAQTLALSVILRRVASTSNRTDRSLPSNFVHAFERVLDDRQADKALLAEALMLPSESYIADQMTIIDIEGIHEARRELKRELANRLRDSLVKTMNENQSNQAYRFRPDALGRRALKNLCLSYLMELAEADIVRACLTQLETADNMTDQLAALSMLANYEGEERERALTFFEHRWQDDPLVMDKWLSVRATSHRAQTLADVEALLRHRAFDIRNPNRVRALIGAFCHNNPIRFHAVDGSGYRFLADQVLSLDAANPQLAARLISAFGRWRRFDDKRQSLMHAQLERILTAANLSRDSYEIASKSLNAQ